MAVSALKDRAGMGESCNGRLHKREVEEQKREGVEVIGCIKDGNVKMIQLLNETKSYPEFGSIATISSGICSSSQAGILLPSSRHVTFDTAFLSSSKVTVA